MREPDREVIVVDNTQGDPETERVSTGAGARYVVEERVGLSRARNTGIDEATGDLVAFLDDDAIADPAWLGLHREVLADDSLMGSTGPILPLAGTEKAWLDLGETPFVVDRSDPWWFERANFGGVAPGGSNMVVKRRAFENGLRFRETLGSGADLQWFEEHYLFFMMIKGGSRVAYVPDAVVRHEDPGPSELPESHRTARAYRYRAAYLTMLLVEEPEFRLRTIRYLVQTLSQEQLPWRDRPPPSRLRMLAAGFRGPLLYLRSRLARHRASRDRRP
jgi:glycosyltransferase involved in cell wall biosynthesis